MAIVSKSIRLLNNGLFLGGMMVSKSKIMPEMLTG
jgi:hypothetical protein